MTFKFVPSLLAATLLGACSTSSSTADYSFPDVAKMQQEFEARAAALRETYPDFPKIGTTYLTFDPDHKFQVEYYESETRSWLWYGGNDAALPAEWQVKIISPQGIRSPLDKELQTQICWRYGLNTYNPSTKTSGGEFQCTAQINLLQTTVSSLDGDVFDLASGEVPYVRQKCDAPDEFEIHTENTLYSSIGVEDCL